MVGFQVFDESVGYCPTQDCDGPDLNHRWLEGSNLLADFLEVSLSIMLDVFI